ncbi:phytoene desaturase family protein [Subtercola sp. Z020]|uniref:phytoene desaturase family protein n=1 Tax=Subtercola sp. Z020 TaxID=2080582 RepID=UPI001E5D0B9C|nr:phytoene desaturase family protein [Subtercola sp. Z020]
MSSEPDDAERPTHSFDDVVDGETEVIERLPADFELGAPASRTDAGAAGHPAAERPGVGKTAVVIGAGISGLATAGLLARDGYTVTVVEKQPGVGGRAGHWEKNGFRFDTGPSWYLMPEVFDHFYKLMGSSAAAELELSKLDPGYRVLFQDEFHPVDIAASREENLDLFESMEPGAGVRMAGYLDSAAETYELAKEYFLYSTFEDFRPLLKGAVLKRSPRLVRLLLESLNSFAGRTVRDPRLQQILGYPAVFLGSSPYSTPSMYHLMSHLDLDDGVLYPQGGFARVIESIEQLAVDAGVTIVTGAAVSRIVTTDDEVEAAAHVAPEPGPYDYPTDEFDTNVIDRDELRRVLEGEADAGTAIPAGATTAGPTAAGPTAAGVAAPAGATTSSAGTASPDVAPAAPAEPTPATPARVSGIQYLDATGAAHSLSADIVVAATDLRHVETTMLLPELQTYPESYWAKKTAGPSAVLIYLGVDGEIPELAHHTLFFTKTWKDDFEKIFGKGGVVAGLAKSVGIGKPAKTSVPSPASIYVCRPSATDAGVAPEGSENLFVLVPIPADPTIGAGGEDGTGDPQVEAIADAAIAQIAEWAGVPDLASRITVRRTIGPADFANDLNTWNGTALGPAHTLGQSAFFRAGNVSKKVAGLYYAGGSTIPGIGLPMCLISAELVIKRLHGDISTTALPEPL